MIYYSTRVSRGEVDRLRGFFLIFLIKAQNQDHLLILGFPQGNPQNPRHKHVRSLLLQGPYSFKSRKLKVSLYCEVVTYVVKSAGVPWSSRQFSIKHIYDSFSSYYARISVIIVIHITLVHSRLPTPHLQTHIHPISSHIANIQPRPGRVLHAHTGLLTMLQPWCYIR